MHSSTSYIQWKGIELLDTRTDLDQLSVVCFLFGFSCWLPWKCLQLQVSRPQLFVAGPLRQCKNSNHENNFIVCTFSSSSNSCLILSSSSSSCILILSSSSSASFFFLSSSSFLRHHLWHYMFKNHWSTFSSLSPLHLHCHHHFHLSCFYLHQMSFYQTSHYNSIFFLQLHLQNSWNCSAEQSLL